MSSKIYFSDQKSRKPLSYYLVKSISSPAARIMPNKALKHTKKLLLTPAKSKTRATVPNHFQQDTIMTPEGAIATISIGSGKTVLLTHGWSGSSKQFIPLMEKIAEQGYRAIAFDHFAHGQSGGKFANLPLFIKGLKFVIAHTDNLVGIISHSMGTIAALNSSKHLPHVLIAPTFGFYESFKQRILSTGISQKLFHGVLSEVEKEHNMQFENLLAEKHIATQTHPVAAIHDVDDRFAQFTLSQHQAKQHPNFSLHAVSELGHGRIINSDPTWQLVKKQLLN